MMPNRFARGNRDKNEPLITEVLKRYGYPYVLLAEGAGADILVMLSPMILVEVKNPDVPLGDRKLTEIELATQDYCKKMEIPYYVIETPEEMVGIVNDDIL